MDAKEILDLYLFTDNVEQFTEQLNARLKEEAQERYERAKDYYEQSIELIPGFNTDKALRIAAGIEGKEEK